MSASFRFLTKPVRDVRLKSQKRRIKREITNIGKHVGDITV